MNIDYFDLRDIKIIHNRQPIIVNYTVAEPGFDLPGGVDFVKKRKFSVWGHITKS